VRWEDVTGLALESLRLHRMRTGLTVLAVAIGATAVLLLTTLGDAAKGYVVNQFASVGTNLVMISPGRTETAGLGAAISGSTRNLTIDDCEAILRRSPSVKRVAPFSLGSAAITCGGRSRDVFVIGTTSSYQEIRSLGLAAGSFLPPGDPRRGERVAVIGFKLKRELFGSENALGKAIRIAEAQFRVIGLLEPKGQTMGMDFDDVAIIPVATALRIFNQSSLFRISVQARDAASIPLAVEEARGVLIDRHREEDFTVITQDAMLKSFRSIIDALTVALAAIAAISLAVAGIGIMNVMLVSVSERVPEIGLLKALGARPRQITALFLAEAVLLSGVGAIAGLGAGYILATIAARMFPALPLIPSVMWMGIVMALSISLGAIFGLIPARRAAGLAPADALRGRR